MVGQNCLSHQCAGEPNLEQRIDRSGYLKGASTGASPRTPAARVSLGSMIANWMASKFHRLNILGKKYKDIGIAISKERVPSHCSHRLRDVRRSPSGSRSASAEQLAPSRWTES